MKKSTQRFSSKKYQKGAATLLTSLILLFAITLITIYASRNIVTETQIAANDYRAKQAFEAAYAGLEQVMGDLKSNSNRDIIRDLDPKDGVIDSNEVAQPAVALANGGSYVVTYSNPTPNDISLINIEVVGKSDDGVGTRTINRIMQITPLSVNLPDSAVRAGGNVSGGGSATVHNDDTNKTVVAAGTVSGPNTNTASNSSDPCSGNAKGYTTSDATKDGVFANDSNTKKLVNTGKFFEDIFKLSKDEVKELAEVMDCSATCSLDKDTIVETYAGSILWIDGDVKLANNTSPANETPDKALIIIVTGDVDLSGGGKLYGLLYAGSVSAVGTTQFHGSVVSEGDFGSNGNYCVNYDPDALNSSNEQSGPIAPVAGGWRDF